MLLILLTQYVWHKVTICKLLCELFQTLPVYPKTRQMWWNSFIIKTLKANYANI